MDPKVIIVTGANAGIGFGLTKLLVEEGHQVIMACRSLERGQEAMEKIVDSISNPKYEPILYQLDLADMSSIRSFVDKFKQNFKKLSVLVNNAGLSLGENKRRTTKDGFEMVTGTNHLGHFLLTNLLLDLIKDTAAAEGEARIVVVASMAHKMHEEGMGSRFVKPLDFDDLGLEKEGAYTDFQAYKDSKAMNVLFTFHLARLLESSGVTVTCVCPGFVPTTEIGRDSRGCFKCMMTCCLPFLQCCGVTRSIQTASSHICNLCVGPDMRGITGEWYMDGQRQEPSAESQLVENQALLWDWSRKQCDL